MTKPPHLLLIQGTKAPESPAEEVRKRVRKMDKPATMVQCHRCGGREVIETKIGVMMKNGKPTGGTKALICVVCLLGGHRVVVS